MGVTSNQAVIETAETLGLISPNMNSKSEARFFQKSYGANARKPHLKNYAPGYSIQQFAEVGISYHEYKKWREYKNDLSYALLGMAVLTGREPSMANGVYTNCGKSFAKHLEADWAKWFYANEFTASTIVKKDDAVKSDAKDTDLTAEYTVESESSESLQLPAPPDVVILDMASLSMIDETPIKPTELALIDEAEPTPAAEVVEFESKPAEKPKSKRRTKKAA
jgi:hypothetical protein